MWAQVDLSRGQSLLCYLPSLLRESEGKGERGKTIKWKKWYRLGEIIRQGKAEKNNEHQKDGIQIEEGNREFAWMGYLGCKAIERDNRRTRIRNEESNDKIKERRRRTMGIARHSKIYRSR